MIETAILVLSLLYFSQFVMFTFLKGAILEYYLVSKNIDKLTAVKIISSLDYPLTDFFWAQYFNTRKTKPSEEEKLKKLNEVNLFRAGVMGFLSLSVFCIFSLTIVNIHDTFNEVRGITMLPYLLPSLLMLANIFRYHSLLLRLIKQTNTENEEGG